jgi:cytochrome c oxidase assembly protein subunit 11
MTENKKLLLSICCLILGMAMLTYASVPIYSLFCKITGYGGTTQIAKIMPKKHGNKKITIKFNANTDEGLPWYFSPIQESITIKTGEVGLIFYSAENHSKESVVGTATYNVTPDKAGIYFNKIQCFCFEEQLLKAGQKMPMPVSFFIDPAIEDDPSTKDVDVVTLSYTFFRIK